MLELERRARPRQRDPSSGFRCARTRTSSARSSAVAASTHVDPGQLDTAAVLAAHVAASLDAAFALQRERQSAVTDPLTGILNRRGLEERLERELAVAQERRLPLSLLVIDCDDFKEINDRAGHEFGDALLREIAEVLVASASRGRRGGRLGGDEFVVMLPGAGRRRWPRRSAPRSGRSSRTG